MAGRRLARKFAEAHWPRLAASTINAWWDDSTKRNIIRSVNGWYGSGANWVSLFFHPNKTGWIISNTIRQLNVCARSVRTLLAHNSTPSSKDTLHGGRRMTDLSKRALKADLDERFWTNHWKTDMRFARTDEDVIVRIIAAIAGVQQATIATSRPNHGAITGIKDRQVVEYTQTLFGDNIQPAGYLRASRLGAWHHGGAFRPPNDAGRCLGSGRSENARTGIAYLSYPAYSSMATNLYRELFAIFDERISAPYKEAVKFL